MVDEMRIMRMNILRWKAVHYLLFGAHKFQNETKWTHVLSARLVPIPSVVLLTVLVRTWLDILQLKRD